ncbi:uncharacterized protein LOC125672631 [Ostrea edulis]|uniref:uncharacterized protein LOC125672631 n=1 Tax=Ostrea edulis TaxID=37623 RepID=UPI0024AF5265|nr:uncharacterized protein LOC125672631 [Ostrea edulis]
MEDNEEEPSSRPTLPLLGPEPAKPIAKVDSSENLETDCIGETQPNPEMTIENELQRFLGCKILEKDQNITAFEWWKCDEQFYRRLGNTARKYLAMPASLVSSERVFGLCGNLVNKK